MMLGERYLSLFVSVNCGNIVVYIKTIWDKCIALDAIHVFSIRSLRYWVSYAKQEIRCNTNIHSSMCPATEHKPKPSNTNAFSTSLFDPEVPA